MRACLVLIALLPLCSCAHTDPLPKDRLTLSLSLQPAIDQGYSITRVLAKIGEGGLEFELDVDGDMARGGLDDVVEGDYRVRVSVHVERPALFAGEDVVHVGDGDVVVDFVDWDDLLPELPRRILFIGNSLTHYNGGLAPHFEAMTAAGMPVLDLSAEMVVGGGYRLETHWSEQPSPARAAITTGGYDWVVLQGSPSGIVNDPGSFAEFGALFIEEIRAAGAEPALFMPHSYQGEDGYIETIASACEALGESEDVRVIPLSRAWYDCRRDHPELDLWTEDHVHPTAVGSYLYLCTIYSSLIQIRPSEAAYDMGGLVDADSRAIIEVSAWSSVSDYEGR